MKHTILLLLGLFLLFSCEEIVINNDDKLSTIELTITENDDGSSQLEWTMANTSSFQKYWLVRSSDSIPNSFHAIDLNNSILIELEDYKEHTYQDLPTELSNQAFYRVFVELNDRKLVSNEVTGANDIHIFNFLAVDVEFSVSANALYLLAHPSRNIYKWDISQSTLHTSNAANHSDNYGIEIETIDNQEHLIAFENSFDEFFSYDLDLNYEKAISFSGHACQDAAISNSGIILGSMFSAPSILTFDYHTDNLLHTFNSPNNSAVKKIETISNQSENHFIETGSDNKLHLYKVDSAGVVFEHTEQELTPPSYFNDIAISPDQQHFAGNTAGLIFNKDLSLFGQIQSDVTFQNFAFSSNGEQLVAIRGNSSKQDIVIYKFPELTEERVIPLGYSASHVFMKGNQLVIIGQNYINGVEKFSIQTFYL